MKRFFVLGLTGFSMLFLAGIVAFLTTSGPTYLRLAMSLLFIGSIACITLALIYPIREVRSRVRTLNRTINKIKSTGNNLVVNRPKSGPTPNRNINAYQESLNSMVGSLPAVNGSHHFEPAPISIALIGVASEELLSYVDHVASMDLTEETIKSFDGVLVSLNQKPNDQSTRDLIAAANEADIPIIFQLDGEVSSIVDLDLVAYGSVVLHPDNTEAEKVVAEYNIAKVQVGSLGVDISELNPVGSQRYSLRRALYSGSYPEDGEAKRDAEIILGSLLNSERLAISERKTQIGSSFPDPLSEIVFRDPSLPRTMSLHKLFSYAIHLSDDKLEIDRATNHLDSLQALAIPVLANYSVRTFNQYPSVRILPEQELVSSLFTKRAIRDSDYTAQNAAVDLIVNNNRYKRLGEILQLAGLAQTKKRADTILVVARGDFSTVVDVVDSQSWSDTHVIRESDLENEDLSQYGYVSVISDSISYGKNYLRGRMSAFMYTDSLIVSQENGYRQETFSAGRVHEFIEAPVDPEISLISTAHPDLFELVSGSMAGSKQSQYMVDPYQIDYSLFQSAEIKDVSVPQPILSVIVPVYNNGTFLIHKAMESLKLNECFAQMEILLIDDGSDDPETIAICEALEGVYPGVKYHSFADGGSGSASRPRNYGLDTASADLITFLDPDNEISIGGYDLLIDHYRSQKESNANLEFVSGFQVKVAVRRAYTGKHTSTDVEVVDDFHEKFFSRGVFPVISTQASVISRDFFLRTNLRFVEKAVGQDTLFGWELILNAKAGAFVKDAFLLYYAERGDSVTNVIGSKYFSGVLINEISKREVLESHGVLEVYIKNHMPMFMKTWYLPRLARVPEDEYVTARSNLESIAALYGHELSDFEE